MPNECGHIWAIQDEIGRPFCAECGVPWSIEFHKMRKKIMSKVTVTVSGETGSGKSAIAGEIEIALKAIGVPVTMTDRDTMVIADYQHWIDLYKPEVTIIEENIPCPTIR
jgi:hypothetical protein